ncbi:TPA: transcriptional regulator TdcA [Escherichia coli]|nr:transcriptional regulator TdcA [Escherichia coli]HBC0974485.1 transcriptional regulator TdcA [Escherichia coli]
MENLPKSKSLMVFLEVARSGGIMNASKNLNITQPSVTRIIRELENYVGTPLFDRTNSGVSLNHAGNVFHEQVLSYINGLQKSVSEIRKEFGRDNKKFSLGYSSLVGYTVLPDVINEFRECNRNVSISIYEGQLSNLLPLLSIGSLDCAIGTMLNEELPYEYNAELLFKSRFSVFTSVLSSYSRARNLQELQGAKWVLPVTCFGYYHNLTEFLKRAGINVDNAIRTDSISSIINLVSCADYVTVLAKPMGEGRNKKLSLRPVSIEEKLPTADYYLTWSKKYVPSRLLSEFMRIIKARTSVSVWGK